MNITQYLDTPGDHTFMFPGNAGQIEAVLTVPEHPDPGYIAMLGHPHSLQGGSMQNKVVTTLARAFKELGVASIRFNFRGVGQSAGVYDAGVGESEDMLVLTRAWLKEMPEARVLFAGFSFGSYVAWRAAAHCKHELLISVAPPVHHYNYDEYTLEPGPWIVVQGDLDEVVPVSVVEDFLTLHPSIQLLEFPDTGHFFHGKLILLKDRLIEAIKQYVIT